MSRADPAFGFDSAPIPLPPFPAGWGEPKFYFAGGFAPGTPALNRLRHLQTLRTGARRGRLFTTRVPTAPAGANAPFEAERTGFPQAMPVPCPTQSRGCKGRSPLHKKTKNLPLPAGKSALRARGGGMGAEKQTKGGVSRHPAGQAPRQAPQWLVEPPTPGGRPPAGCLLRRFNPCRAPPSPGDARGEAPCIRKLKSPPSPPGKGAGDRGKQSKLTAG